MAKKSGLRQPTTGRSRAKRKPGVFVSNLPKGRNVEHALRESEARFSLFMHHLPGVAFLKDLQGRYVYVSPGFVNLTGRAPGLCLGSSDEEYWPESAARLNAEDQYVVQTGNALTAEDCRTVGGETRHYQTVKFPIPDEHGTPVLVAGISVDITHKKAAEEDRKVLLARLATAHEEERRRISRELHDDLTQRLAALAMESGRIAARRLKSATLLKEELRALQRGIVQAAEAARHIAHELHPSELDDLGLVTTLRSYCEDFAMREDIAIEFESRDVPNEVTREIGSCVYKVIQESLRNVARHAATRRASVILEGAGESIRLRVKDSGVGFSAASPENSVGLGLLGMEERVGLLRGNFRVWSQPGKGTEVVAEIPLEP